MTFQTDRQGNWPRRTIAAFGVALFVVMLPGQMSCTAGEDRPSPEEFDFRLTEEVGFNVEVRHSNSPIPRALVQITSEGHRTVSGQSDGGGSVYYRGYTDSEGRVTGVFLAPTTEERFSVVVQARGYDGPYSDSVLMTALGHFAPSSWQGVTARELNGMTVALALSSNEEPSTSGAAPPPPSPTPGPPPPPQPPPATNQSQTGIIDDWSAVPPEVLTAVGDALPEQSNAGAAFLASSLNPNLHVLETATVKLLFLHEGAGYRNSVGYFTYTVGGDGTVTIGDSNLVWPNASLLHSGGQLQPGFTSYLRDANGDVRTFAADTYIGFFLVANGWNGSAVTSWTGPGSLPHTAAAANSGSPNIYSSLELLNPERSGAQPELSKHLAVITMPAVSGFLNDAPYILLGFEDLRRDYSSDDDFNDAVFVVQSDPVEAIDMAALFQLVNADSDGDGLEGLDDAFPVDAERAYVDSYPSDGYYTLAYEDQYPYVGDADYNDAVFLYRFDRVFRADGLLKDLVGTFHLVARGAGRNSAFALRLSQLPPGLTATITLERVSSGGDRTLSEPIVVSVNANGHLFVELLPSLIDVLPPPEGEAFTNTLPGVPERPAASVRLKVTLSQPVDPTLMALPPYDPILLVQHGDAYYDVHLIGKSPLANRPVELPNESGPLSFMDDNFFPWALSLPFDWAHPRENIHIGGAGSNDGAYPQFRTWRESAGYSAMDWFSHPSNDTAKVGPGAATLVPSRTFQIGAFQ
jgi:LruC domain-containing protein